MSFGVKGVLLKINKIVKKRLYTEMQIGLTVAE